MAAHPHFGTPRTRVVSSRLVEMLDHIERRVETLREHATAMEHEKECLLEMLQALQTNKELLSITEHEREEIQVNAERLVNRCLSVDITVSTPRNSIQEQALKLVNQNIDELVTRIKDDIIGSRQTCQAYLNACLSDPYGIIDQRFQSVVIDCTADDQKKIRKRLESLLRTIDHAQKSNRH